MSLDEVIPHRPLSRVYSERNHNSELSMASVSKRATDGCDVPPLGIVVQAVSLSPYRSGVAAPDHTRLLVLPAFPTCYCPLAFSGSGELGRLAVISLNCGHLRWLFLQCVTWRTVSLSRGSPVTDIRINRMMVSIVAAIRILRTSRFLAIAVTCRTSPCTRRYRAPWWHVTSTTTIATP